MQQYSIRELRARKGYTQRDMSKIVGVSLTTYNKWENNLNDITVSKLKRIADALQVSVNEIFLP